LWFYVAEYSAGRHAENAEGEIMKVTLAMLAAGLALTAGAAGAAVPGEVLDTHYQVVDCRKHDSVQEQADLALATKAFGVMQTHDMAKIDALMPDVRAALNRAPDVAAQPELCDGKVVIYTEDTADFLIVSAMVTGGKVKGATSAEMRYAMPYGSLGFIVGWIEYEHQDFNNALKDYAKGLRNEPDNSTLESEYASTLINLGRINDALQSVDGFMAARPALKGPDKGKLLRKRGYVLVELGRWDEGEAAYRQSLVEDPGNSTALGELDYIAKSRPKKPAA
jgi:tetratricopeptide (TPR) repeat protein